MNKLDVFGMESYNNYLNSNKLFFIKYNEIPSVINAENIDILKSLEKIEKIYKNEIEDYITFEIKNKKRKNDLSDCYIVLNEMIISFFVDIDEVLISFSQNQKTKAQKIFDNLVLLNQGKSSGNRIYHISTEMRTIPFNIQAAQIVIEDNYNADFLH